ncbi:hypothetical protein LEP1GSC103_1510 [Leptospira borgpetersenii serovar Javanica str. UI 09931]|uniref:Uncharacterized protein n=3 Tax=Leptospira borgpetersenii TaxID=174 RepID=A0ABP2S1U8_LEPBO|nr:hypothetical protein C4Q31_11795 [Leptospira borgpetersenii serovar Ceylonica]EKP12104.1 hypothetical protein LEP1GSC128_0295 [Leptospira borgpetersenii str. 200801926]EKR00629.1 hypothetical protein LEP1GSC121_1150 [Leptospira borgpetersenii serovar Castellonis str. 200801910]EMN12518.1 hypothetical protein LEP1GSC055_3004 [Leptospira borgpetersenii str. Brem 307]EMN16530.1 hypothetical protein LEP1GSC056_3244 [Leptospira borgpetersenii str. Brem 328]ENO61930.1 hypothetical protein LEP1GSC
MKNRLQKKIDFHVLSILRRHKHFFRFRRSRDFQTVTEFPPLFKTCPKNFGRNIIANFSQNEGISIETVPFRSSHIVRFWDKLLIKRTLPE